MQRRKMREKIIFSRELMENGRELSENNSLKIAQKQGTNCPSGVEVRVQMSREGTFCLGGANCLFL